MAVASKTKAGGESTRLDAAAWIQAALEVLADQGIDGVRVEPLAKRLGVTKGSFYWHFKDRGALAEAMLDDWRRRATVGIIDRLERDHEPPPVRLERLLRLPFSSPRSERGADVELSIRLWGRRDPKARAALEEVDTLRLRYMARLLEGCGVPREESEARATLAYSYMRVSASLISREQTALMAECERTLMRP